VGFEANKISRPAASLETSRNVTKEKSIGIEQNSPPSRLMSISDSAQKQSRKRLATVGISCVALEVFGTLPVVCGQITLRGPLRKEPPMKL